MVTPAQNRASSVIVHESGNRSLDGIFRLIEVASQPVSLDEVLAAMCIEVATIAPADVVSVYVREECREAGVEGQVFTMRGNVGFPAEAVGRVRLRVGEGIVGFVADRLRPVSVDMAERDEHFKYVPGLGEERFPALLAVPVLRGPRAAGVLVLQRSLAGTFTGEEVVLATALAAVISHALERADERARTQRADRTVARLRGVALSGGTAMGRAEILPTLAALARTSDPPGPGHVTVEAVTRRLRAALQNVGQNASVAFGREIASLALILDDHRFCGRLALASGAAAPLKAFSELAREYARVPFRTNWGDGATTELMIDRASEIEDLCVLVHAGMSGRPVIRAGAIVVGERLRAFLALAAISGGASAFVIEGDVPDHGIVAEIVRAAGVPLLKGVTGVFSWIRPDDLLVVDGETGSVRVNPEATAVARFRTQRA